MYVCMCIYVCVCVYIQFTNGDDEHDYGGDNAAAAADDDDNNNNNNNNNKPTCNTVFTRVIHALFLTKILYLNLGCDLCEETILCRFIMKLKCNNQ